LYIYRENKENSAKHAKMRSKKTGAKLYQNDEEEKNHE
jgi:hypothetical protein